MECNEEQVVNKIRVKRKMLEIKSDIKEYLYWCKIIGVSPDDDKALEQYLSLVEFVALTITKTSGDKNE